MKEYLFSQTYETSDELERLGPILEEACKYQKGLSDYLVPYSFWGDRDNRLYIRWIKNDQEYKPVWRYGYEGSQFIAEEMTKKPSKTELLRGNNPDLPVMLITGDTHRRFERLISFITKFGTVDGDMVIILGDACINYYGDYRDDELKARLNALPIRLLCIHGNHEIRPETTGLYSKREWHGGTVYVEDRYPNIMFAADGGIFDICGYNTLVIGGAYSADKHYRLSRGWQWFSDEQPSEETKAYVEKQLDKLDWKVDVVLSHTVPFKYRPTEMFIRDLDQSTVDSSTEKWLGTIEERLSYKRWYAGHFHCDKEIDNIRILYRKIVKYMDDTDLGFEKE